MEDYNLESINRSPHVIDCGHILCLTYARLAIYVDETSDYRLRCITTLPYAVCPLCRSDFDIQNPKKLYVGTSAVENSVSAADQRTISLLLDRIDLVSRDDSSEEDILTAMDKVDEWLREESNADEMRWVSNYLVVVSWVRRRICCLTQN